MPSDIIFVNDKPIVTLIPKKINSIFLLIFYFMFVLPFAVFVVILPVIYTGSYAAVWPVGDKNIVKKTIMFYISWISILSFPAFYQQLKIGCVYFYSNRIEVIPFLTKKRITLYYDRMHVWFIRNWNMTITSEPIPNLWKNPLRRIKVQFVKGVLVVLSPKALSNPSDARIAVQILKENVSDFTEKHSLYL